MTSVEAVDRAGDRVHLVDVDGVRVCNFHDREPEYEAELVRKLKKFKCRQDDVFILAPVKSGTHWTWEIASMLVAGRAETIPKSKVKHMLEHQPAEAFDVLESPRILNSHLAQEQLPEEIFKNRLKIINVLRNPKDMLVSFYHHVKGIHSYHYEGKWENFFELFLNDELEYGSWFKYVRDWERFIKENPDHPVHVIHYEDLHKDFISEVKRLAVYLEVQPNDELVQGIAEKCNFNHMTKAKVYPDNVRRQVFKGDFTMYRKGVVGDWKNWFTVEQAERFDQCYNERMEDSDVHFDYTVT